MVTDGVNFCPAAKAGKAETATDFATEGTKEREGKAARFFLMLSI